MAENKMGIRGGYSTAIGAVHNPLLGPPPCRTLPKWPGVGSNSDYVGRSLYATDTRQMQIGKTRPFGGYLDVPRRRKL